ncbi:MAG: AAA family ATPase [Planctomycetota bacterium]
MGIKIAIGGKGGVGKTTVCSIWAQLFAQDGLDVLVIDADPNTNLCSSFGIPPHQSPEPLIRMKQLINERTGTSGDAVGDYFKLNPHVSDLPEKYCLNLPFVLPEKQNYKVSASLKLLVLGGITQGGAGCACPEGAFLRALLTHSILYRQEMVIVDLAAGVEFFGRASIQGIDALVIVVEPGSRSIDTAINIAKMAKDLGVNRIAAIANKVSEPAQLADIKSQLKDMHILGSVTYSPLIQQADLQRKVVFEVDSQTVNQLDQARNILLDTLFSQADNPISQKNIHDRN